VSLTNESSTPTAKLFPDGVTIDYVYEKGHRLDTAHGKCIRCNAFALDLYEDPVYGGVRDCKPTKAEDTPL